MTDDDKAWQPDPLLTIDELSAWLGISVSTLYGWASKSRRTGIPHGPRALRIGRHLRYRRSDVERWLGELPP